MGCCRTGTLYLAQASWTALARSHPTQFTSSVTAKPQLCVTVSVSVCLCGYRQVGVPAPKKPSMVTSPALLDTGAQMVVSGMDLVHRLGVTRKELFPMTNSEGLKLVRGLLITVSATGSDQECYVSRNVNVFVKSSM